MSTYCSDTELNVDTAGFSDVAYCCMGTDVRVIGFDHEYLTPDDAREIAAALVRAADHCDSCAEWMNDQSQAHPDEIPATQPTKGEQHA